MKVDQARQLLQNKLQEEYDREVATDLVCALECMPLAITQASAYILRRAPRMSSLMYLNEFMKSDKKKENLLNQKNIGDLRRDETAANSVITTWQITFDQIRRERRSAADLLYFMSFFNPQGIPEWVLQSYQRNEGNSKEGLDDSGEDEFYDDIETLRGYSLVAVTTQNDIWEMHALVQFCTRSWLSSFENTENRKCTFLQVISREYPSGEYSNWAKCHQLDPHIETLLETEPEDEKGARNLAQLLTNSGWYEWQIGRYETAQKRLNKAVIIRERSLGAEHPDTLKSVGILGLLLQAQGKYDEAEPLARQALEGYTKALGIEHLDTLTSVDNFASLLQAQGKYDEAEPLARHALEGYTKALGIEHLDTLTSVNNLALLLQTQGKYDEAEPLARQALEGKIKALGTKHLHTLTSVNNLALLLQTQGKYDEAEPLLRRALEGRIKALGTKHPRTLTSVNNLALLLQYQGKYDEAEPLARRALEGYTKALGAEHPDTLTSVHNLASLLRKQGKYDEAERCKIRASSTRPNY
jgi:tetratricopeptide (TPR) repeat protein